MSKVTPGPRSRRIVAWGVLYCDGQLETFCTRELAEMMVAGNPHELVKVDARVTVVLKQRRKGK